MASTDGQGPCLKKRSLSLGKERSYMDSTSGTLRSLSSSGGAREVGAVRARFNAAAAVMRSCCCCTCGSLLLCCHHKRTISEYSSGIVGNLRTVVRLTRPSSQQDEAHHCCCRRRWLRQILQHAHLMWRYRYTTNCLTMSGTAPNSRGSKSRVNAMAAQPTAAACCLQRRALGY